MTAASTPEEMHTLVKFRQRNLPGFATINTALKKNEWKSEYSRHLSIVVECVDLIENRLPSRAEQDVLYRFEDQIDQLVRPNRNGLFLARITHDAQREMIWRIRNPEVAQIALQNVIQMKSLSREFGYRMDEDPDWDKASWCLSNV